MANVSTLQQRQQEIHRPFQPFTSTEGRAGKAIAEPQEQYAGGWAVAADTTGRLGSLLRGASSGGSGSKKEEINPDVADVFAEAAMGAEREYATSTPEQKEMLDKLAAEKDQTSSGYLKQIYAIDAEDKARALGARPAEIVKAREAYFKWETSEIEKVEQRQAAYNKKLIDWSIDNNQAVLDRFGNVDDVRTLDRLKPVIEGVQALKNGEDWTLIEKDTGISREMWDRMTEEDKKINGARIAESLYPKYVAPAILLDMNALTNAFKVGDMPAYRDTLARVSTTLDEAIASINTSMLPTETKNILTGRLTDFRNNTLKSFENLPEKNTKDLQDAFNVSKIKLLAQVSNRNDIIGKLARASLVLPDQTISQLFNYWSANSPYAFTVAQDIDTALTSLSVEGLNSFLTFTDNVASINQGKEPTTGTTEEQRQAKAYVDKSTSEYLQQTGDYTRSDSIIPLKEKEAEGYLGTIADGGLMLLQNVGSVKGKENDIIGDFIHIMSRKDYIPFLMRSNQQELRRKYIEATPSITDKFLLSPQVSGVLKSTDPNENRWISFDTTNKKFITGQASKFLWVGPGLSGGTTNWTMNGVVDDLNEILNAKRNAGMLYLDRDLTDDEVNSIVQNMYSNMKAVGVNGDLFKENNYGLTQISP